MILTNQDISKKTTYPKKFEAKAKESIWRVWSEDLNTAAGPNKMLEMAKQMRKYLKNVQGTNFI